MSRTAKHGIQGTAKGTFEPIAIQLAIPFHMPDRRFDRTAAGNHGFEPAWHTAFLPGASNLYMVNLNTLVAAVDEQPFRLDVRQDGSLLQRFVQRVPIVRIARHGARPDHQALFQRRHDRRFDAELVAHVRLALANAFDFRCMQRLQLVLCLLAMLQNALGTAEKFVKPFPHVRWHAL
jgi:hypothetical protein